MKHSINDQYENLITGERVIITDGYPDVNPNNEKVYCYSLETISKSPEQEIKKYHITEPTLEFYYERITQ